MGRLSLSFTALSQPLSQFCVTLTWTFRSTHRNALCLKAFKCDMQNCFNKYTEFCFFLECHIKHLLLNLFQRRKSSFFSPPCYSLLVLSHAYKYNTILEKDESICQAHALNFSRHISVCTNSVLMSTLSKYNFHFNFIWWGNFVIIISRMMLSPDFKFAHANVNA